MASDDYIKTTVEELRKLVSINNLIGEPIETEDKLIIPVMKMGIGFGGGKNTKNTDDLLASGAAAGIEPVSMVVISKNVKGIEGIRVLNITKGSEINKAITDLGLVVTDLIKDLTSKKDKKESVTVDVDPKE